MKPNLSLIYPANPKEPPVLPDRPPVHDPVFRRSDYVSSEAWTVSEQREWIEKAKEKEGREAAKIKKRRR